MVPVRASLSQRSRNIRAKQAPRAPSQVRARELMRTPKFRPALRDGLGTSKNLPTPTAVHVRRMVLGACATLARIVPALVRRL